MKKITYLLAAMCMLLVISCTPKQDAYTIARCPCAIVVVKYEEKYYEITIEDKDRSRVTFYTTVKHAIGDTIQ